MDGQQNDALAIANQIREKKQEVRYGTREYVAEYLVGKFKTEDFYIPLEYQRNFVWSDEDCSYFIESVLIGLPIPYMFFADTEDGRTEIVDGAQRMNALVTFVNGDLTLRGLKILTAVNSKVYSELPIEVQRRFNNASFLTINIAAFVVRIPKIAPTPHRNEILMQITATAPNKNNLNKYPQTEISLFPCIITCLH